MHLYVLDALMMLYALKIIKDWTKRREQTFPLPPKPKGLPVIGPYLDLREGEVFKTAKEWGDQYGNIILIECFGLKLIVLNSLETIRDLFERRGQIYSSRPWMPMIELEELEWVTTIQPYGDRLKKDRKYMHQHLQKTAIGSFSALQVRSTYRILLKLLDEEAGNDFASVFRDAIAESVILAVYGYQAQEKNDPYIEIGKSGLNAFFTAQNFNLVNLIPALRFLPRWLPGIPFLRTANEGRKASRDTWQTTHEMAKLSLKCGSAIPSMWSKLMEEAKNEYGIAEDEEWIAQVHATIYAGSLDTVLSALSTFILAMVLHPDAQQHAQEEIDRFLGKDHLPTLEDQPNLPYISAIIKEVLRWQIVLPWGIPRVASEDDVYNGYFIPKDVMILSNLWAITRNANEYPQPDEFIPERWTVPEDKRPLDPAGYVFGFSRRICPGRFFAENMLFIIISNILATFKVEKAVGDDGELITPSVKYTTTPVRQPMPFKCKFVPRTTRTESLIRLAYASTR